MILGVLQVELWVGDANSLKDKRRVLTSIKDRLRRHHNVAVAEVDQREALRTAVLGIVTVSNSGRHAESVLNRIMDRLREHREAVVQDHQTEIVSGR